MTTYSNIRYAAAGVTEYATANDLPTSAAAGSQAFVADNNRLYIWNGTGWYNIALINTNPSISGVSSSYDLAQDGTATTVTIVASDPEGLPITYSLASDTSGSTATVVQGTGASTNVFTITPSTSDANAGTFTLTFRASDGVNIATAPAEFSLAFAVVNSPYTSALITSVGADSAVNNTFIDSSTNSHTITAFGDAHQTTFSPYRHGGYSARFTGSASYFATDNTSVIGTGDFTWEAWVKTTDDAGTLWMKYNGGNQADGISLTAGVVRTHLDVGLDPTTGSINIADGNWHYIVVERYNGTLKTFVDGTQDSSTSNSENASRTGAWFIGKFGNNGAVDWAGEIRDLRFSHNTAEYQGSLSSSDIPTETVTARASTTITLFTGKPYFENGTPTSVISDPTSPYDYTQYSSAVNGGSMSFDGTGDYLNISNDASLSFGTGEFTFEFWMYRTAKNGTYQSIVSALDESGTGAQMGFFAHSTDTIQFYSSNANLHITSNTIKSNTWHHICATRNSSSVLKIYIDGIEGYSATITDNFNTGANGLNVGRDVSSGNGTFAGSVADVRLVKGTVVYTANFTPPTAPLTAITNTSLLLKGTNAGIIDKSQTVQAITLNGDAKSSTTVYKYLTSSMAFDGTGDFINFSDDDSVFSNDYTIEFWVYPTQDTTLTMPLSKGVGLQFYLSGGNIAAAISSSNNTTYFYHSNFGSITTNAWSHVSLVRDLSASTYKFYINGTLEHTLSSSTNISAGSANWIIGGYSSSGQYPFQGYMSDVRITKGLARYTSAFTPPTAALKG